jgi:hypothetical protein
MRYICVLSLRLFEQGEGKPALILAFLFSL